MTVKCEKCGAEVELQEGATSAVCEKCGAEVSAKDEAAAEAKAEAADEAAAEEAKAEAADEAEAPAKEKTPIDPKKLVLRVFEVLIILAALAFVPRICIRVHQHVMSSKGMPLTQDKNTQLLEYKNAEAESVVLPGCFTSIGEFAFRDCAKLKTVTLSTTVKEIGEGAFAGLKNLEEVKISGGAGIYAPFNFITRNPFAKDTTPCVIGKSAFSDCGKLKSIDLPKGLTAIGDSAFEDCKALTAITIPETVTEIGMNAFARSGLKKVVIPASVKTVGRMAFNYCSNLEEITVPKSFTDAQIKSWGINAEKCKVVKR